MNKIFNIEIISCQEKQSKKGNIYCLIHGLELADNNKIIIYDFNNIIKEKLKTLEKKLHNYIFNIEVQEKKEKNKIFYYLINIKNIIEKKLDRNILEEIIISIIYKYYKTKYEIIKDLISSEFYKNKIHIKFLKDIIENNDRPEVYENLLEKYIQKGFKYHDISEKEIIKYKELFFEEIKKEKIKKLQEKLLNGSNDKEILLELEEFYNSFDKLKNISNKIEDLSLKNKLIKNSDIFTRYKNNEVLGCPFGLKMLDELTDGVYGLTGLTGAPGFGKTSLAIQTVVYNSIINNNYTIYVSLEVPSDMFIIKIASFLSEIYFKKILKQFLSLEEAEKLYNNIEKLLDNENLFILDNNDYPTLENLKKYVRELKKKIALSENPDRKIMIVIDYLNIWNLPEYSHLQEMEKIKELIKELINFKNNEKVNILMIMAKNKQGYKVSDMGSIKGANDIEYGMETIISLEDPATFKDLPVGDYNVIASILKNRWGQRGRVPLKFDGSINHFYEVNIEEEN